MPIPSKKIGTSAPVASPRTEGELQALCEKYLEMAGILYTRVPDNLWNFIMGTRKSTNKNTTAMRMSAIKYLAGVPDFLIFGQYPNGEAACLLIELKTEKGKLRASQVEFAKSTTVYVVRSFQDFVSIVEKWQALLK